MPIKPQKNRIPMLNQDFHHWTVLADAGYRGASRMVLVRCCCGREVVRQAGSIRTGRSRSCGCQRKRPDRRAKP